MKKNDFVKKSLLLGVVSLAFCACGNGELDSEEVPETPRLSITVSGPAPESVMVMGARTRAGLQGEADESEIRTLNVYLFKKNEQGSAETDYTFFEEYSFGGNDQPALTDGGNSSKSCSIDILPELVGQNVKIVLIANDEPKTPALIRGQTTLADFRAALATAVVTAGDAADKLVGDGTAGFPMSTVSNDTRLTSDGVSAKVVLVRNVASIDICHHAPGLTIKSVKLKNANDKSCLLGNAVPAQLNVPGQVGRIELKPLKAYNDLLTNGIGYKEDGDKEANTHRAFYLYEQSVTGEEDSPVVIIGYEIVAGPGRTKAGSVTVQFRKTSDGTAFVNVRRNYLYTIELGDGNRVEEGGLQAGFMVDDWQDGEEINDDLKPGTDSQAS